MEYGKESRWQESRVRWNGVGGVDGAVQMGYGGDHLTLKQVIAYLT